jgi:Rad3-related DNA helicase
MDTTTSLQRRRRLVRRLFPYHQRDHRPWILASGAKESKRLGSNPLHVVQTFIVTLINANEDGKIIVTTTTSKVSATATVSLKYQLLNPSRVFQEVVESARAVVLVGYFPFPRLNLN